MNAKHFFTQDQKLAITKAITQSELQTSGEIRLHIDSNCEVNVLDSATVIFRKLKMHKTELRNGVLFYLAVTDKKFAILGDKGINEKVPENFWDNIKELMLDYFKKQQFTEGLCKGIEMAGEKLKTHFPLQSNDINEITNEISIGN
jgi:uncharacterized membrane protein